MGKFFPTQKPIELIQWIVKASSIQNDVILDPHMGSGTTLLAALNLCRNSIGIDRNNIAYNIAHKRVKNAINKLPKRLVIKREIIDTQNSIEI